MTLRGFITVIIAIIAFAGLFLSVGFFTGRESIKSRIVEKTIIVTDTVVDMRVLREYVPDIRFITQYLPSRTDTVIIDNIVFIEQSIDTTALIAEFITRRDYFIRIDTAGVVFELEPIVQFNRLQSMPYRLTRTDKEITTNQRERVVIPFVSVSCLTNGSNVQGFGIGVGGGFFLRNWGFEYKYLPTENRHAMGVKRRF